MLTGAITTPGGATVEKPIDPYWRHLFTALMTECQSFPDNLKPDISMELTSLVHRYKQLAESGTTAGIGHLLHQMASTDERRRAQQQQQQ